MFELQTLGVVGLREAGGDVSTVTIVQPKRLAVLVYLAMAPRRRLRRRDQLLGLFWPELDAEHGRGALSQALKHIRKALTPGAIVSQGEEEVGIDGTQLRCDATVVTDAFEAEDDQRVLTCYAGPFFAGFHVGDASADFDDWVARERVRLAELAATSAGRLADRAEVAGDFGSAVRWAREATRVTPDDERVAVNLVRLLDKSGDRVGALRTYDALRRRLRDEFGVGPSSETEQLVATIRNR